MEVINAIGRRKAAVARVYVSEGKGNITINKRPLEEYFTLPTLQYIVKQPLELLGVTGKSGRWWFQRPGRSPASGYRQSSG